MVSSKSNVELSKIRNSFKEAWLREYGELMYSLRRAFFEDYNSNSVLPRDGDRLRISVPINVELSIEDVNPEKEKP